MRIHGGAALGAAVALFVALSASAQAGAFCPGESACEVSCEGGKVLACRELGRIRADGEGLDPDHAGAVAAWTRGCTGAAGKKQAADDAKRDARSCLELSRLQRSGWTLEVTRDVDSANARLTDAVTLATPKCDAGDGDACATVAFALRDSLEVEGWPGTGKDAAKEVLRRAQAGCEGNALEACAYIRHDVWELTNQQLLEPDELKPARDAVDKQLGVMCKGGDAWACLDVPSSVLRDEKNRKAIKAVMTERCATKDPAACLAQAMAMSADIDDDDLDSAKAALVELVELALDACETLDHEECPSIALEMTKEDGEFVEYGVKSDPARGVRMLRSLCKTGSVRACEHAATLLAEGAPSINQDAPASRELYDRACRLTSPLKNGKPVTCEICLADGYDDLAECRRRDTWQVSTRCLEGNLEDCEELGDRYGNGFGVDPSAADSARSFKYACDGSIKTACGKLDDVCHANTDLGEQVCAPSLLHTDVFYEAEWQLRTNQTATLSKGTATTGGDVTSVTVAEANAGGGVQAKRGKLDADLVVSVVLDRARQAAARLLADELRDHLGSSGLRTYMKDLLEQGASLLADSTSLRRDALQDLGMTLVRAFAASNLVRTTLGDADALLAAPVIGVVVKGWKRTQLVKDGRLAPQLEAYLADVAYWTLNTESLFARAGAGDDPAPACPFQDDRKALCDALSTRAKVTEALRIDGVLTALNMVRALGSEGGIDVRRLIEAIAQSRSIVDFASTPGLNLGAWQSRIVEGLRGRGAQLKDGLGTLTSLLDINTYASAGPDLPTLAAQLRALAVFVTDGDGAVLLGADLAKDLTPLLSVASLMPQGLGGAPTPEMLATARERAKAAIDKLGKPWRDGIGKKIVAITKKLDGINGSLDELVRHISSVRTTLEHHQPSGTDVRVRLAIDDVPLGDLDELLLVFPKVVTVLDTLDANARDLFDGIDLRGLRFARSSCVRLLGFLDLMGRVARSVRLTQTVAQVIETLQLLGRWSDGEFSAPLYDMLLPVLDLIETRTPMPLEQLFAIIGRVRLDSLVTSLLSDSPCANEDRAECWVFKIAYSLQEAITRDGDTIKIDGAEVAKRLAKFGDDFRRREKGRWYFHLTVGVGSLFSPPPPDPAGGMSEDLRFTPIIAEQVGFGYASPAVWKDRLTFKVGLAASGVLYRVLLDNEESNAVMGLGFLAVDIYDLVEIYAAGTVLAYPPSDTSDARVEPGVAFGLSVPLSAYLEKL